MRVPSNIDSGHLDRPICGALVLACAVAFLVNAVLLVSKKTVDLTLLAPQDLSDFFVYFSAARLLTDGGSTATLYDFEAFRAFQNTIAAVTGGVRPFVYPPTYLLLIQPLAYAPYPIAFVVWQVAGLLCLAGAGRLAGLRRLELVALVLGPAAWINFAVGQNGLLTSALLVAGWALLARRAIGAGVLFGLLTFKFHLGLLIPIALLAQRNWRAIIAAVAAAAAFAGASVILFGPQSWLDFLASLDQFRQVAVDQELDGLSAYAISPFIAAHIVELPVEAGYALQGLISVLVAAVVYWAFRRVSDPDLQGALFFTGTALVVPYGFLYDLPFLTLAIVLLVRRGLNSGFLSLERPILAGAWLAPFFTIQLHDLGVPVAVILHLCLFTLILRRASSQAQARKLRDAEIFLTHAAKY